jgi:hypothetical protein
LYRRLTNQLGLVLAHAAILEATAADNGVGLAPPRS